MSVKFIQVTATECKGNLNRNRTSFLPVQMFLRLEDITSFCRSPRGGCLISTKTYGANGLKIEDTIEDLLAQMIVAGGDDMFIDGYARELNRGLVHEKIQELTKVNKHPLCIRCGGRVGMISGNWDYFPDDEPYEVGVAEEAMCEMGVEMLVGYKCDDCGNIQNIQTE